MVMSYSVNQFYRAIAWCKRDQQNLLVRRLGLSVELILAILITVIAMPQASYAQVKVEQSVQTDDKPTTTKIDICDDDDVTVRVDVPGFYKLDLNIDSKCKTDDKKSTNDTEKKKNQ